MTGLIGLYGIGGCGRGLMPLLSANSTQDSAKIVFVDKRAEPNMYVNGVEVLTWNAFLEYKAIERSICLGVADTKIRSNLSKKCDEANVSLLGVTASNVVIMDDVEIGDGACLSPFVTLTCNIKIGKAFHGNLYSYVEHDCIIGDFVTFAPGVKCNGDVIIGDYAYIGAGAIIRQGITIGAGATVGMGAVVIKDVPPGMTVVGNPAKILEK